LSTVNPRRRTHIHFVHACRLAPVPPRLQARLRRNTTVGPRELAAAPDLVRRAVLTVVIAVSDALGFRWKTL
jgi:hypothetical protein